MNPDLKTNQPWVTQFLRSSVDGISIRYAIRSEGIPDRKILFLNGRSEWIEKYEDLVVDTQFRENSVWVTMDHRGQGASEGPRSHVASYDHFARDVADVIKATFGNEPYVVIAHSMGGLIALYATLKNFIRPSALVLSSPLFGLVTPIPLGLARILSCAIAHTPWSTKSTGAGTDRRINYENNPLTQSRQRFRKMADPPYPVSSATFGWVHSTFKATATLRSKKLLKDLRIPIAILVGEKERVVETSVYQMWINLRLNLTGLEVKYQIVPGAQHELLNEAERFRDIAIDIINQELNGSLNPR